MTWLKLSDDFAEDCARVELSDAAFRTHVEVLLWCMRRENGGCISVRDLIRSAESQDVEAAVEELIAYGFWEANENGWRVLHHMEHQPEPDLIAKRRASTAERVRKHRRKQAGVDPTDPDDERNAVTEGVTRRVTRVGTGRVGTGTISTTSFPGERSQDPRREGRSTLRPNAHDVPPGELRHIVEKGARVQDRALRLVADVLGEPIDKVRQLIEHGTDERADQIAGLVEDTLVPALVGGVNDRDAKTELRRARDADHDITWAEFPLADGDWKDGT